MGCSEHAKYRRPCGASRSLRTWPRTARRRLPIRPGAGRRSQWCILSRTPWFSGEERTIGPARKARTPGDDQASRRSQSLPNPEKIAAGGVARGGGSGRAPGAPGLLLASYLRARSSSLLLVNGSALSARSRALREAPVELLHDATPTTKPKPDFSTQAEARQDARSGQTVRR